MMTAMLYVCVSYSHDVIVCKGAGLIGGPGLVPGCTIGREYALFELVRCVDSGTGDQNDY